ncbi:MAG TPA: Flp pilus assembly protein CpaB [Patescibacteria group bacterium]|nr:Flp pilus assembly protein CpaB [Patescibacteria group bacterium]
MRPIVIILIAVALGIAGLTAVLLSRYVADQRAQTVVAPQIAGPATEDVLVAAVDIKPGTIIKAEDIRYEAWPSVALDGRFVRRGGAEDPKAGFVGAIAKRALMTGEPMSPQAVFRQDEAGLLSGLLSPGMRAVSIPVTPNNSVSGFILPNDHVDILLNIDVRAATPEADKAGMGGDMARYASEILLSDVRVIAVDDKLARADAATNMTAKTMTLELTPKDAEMVLTATRLGELNLVLRSLAPGAAGDAPPVGYTADVETSRALQAAMGQGGAGAHPSSKAAPPSGGDIEVRINRAGSTSTQSFSN